jgi:hypothetical protein
MGQQRVDVLAVLDDAAQVMGRDGYSAIPNGLAAARAQVAELIEAASAPVLRAAPDDRNWRERGAAFARLDAALSTNEGGR